MVVGDLRADRGEAVARFGSPLEERHEVAALEVRLRRRRPRGELELGLGDREDSAERALAALAVHHRRDEAAAGESQRADFAAAADLQLPGLVGSGEKTDDRFQWELARGAAKGHRSAASVCLSKTWSFLRLKPICSVAPGRVCVSVDTRATNVWLSAARRS